MVKHSPRRSLMAFLGLAFAARAGSAEEFNPYEIPKEQFRQRVHVIALRPLAVPAGTTDAGAVRQLFEPLLTQKLQGKGYTVVASQEFERIWRQMAERVGGVFDPITGMANESKFKAVREHTYRELQRAFHADAVLTARIDIDTYIPWSKPSFGPPHLYVGDELLTWRGEPLAAINLPQKTLATYLDIVITDLDATKLYGIRMPHEWIKFFVARGYEEKPRLQLYNDPGRNGQAIDGALGPLVNSAASATTPAPPPQP